MNKAIIISAVALSALTLSACATTAESGSNGSGSNYSSSDYSNGLPSADEALNAGWPMLESQFTDAYWYEFCSQWRVMPEVAWQDFLYGWNMTNGGQVAGDPSEATFTRNMQNTCSAY